LLFGAAALAGIETGRVAIFFFFRLSAAGKLYARPRITRVPEKKPAWGAACA